MEPPDPAALRRVRPEPLARQPRAAATSPRGELARLRDEGIRGLTSNPTIFQKAIEGSADYDEQFGDLVKARRQRRRRLLGDGAAGHQRRPRRASPRVYDSSDGGDGFVSVEVAPDLAHDTDGTVAVGPPAPRDGQPAQPHGEDPGDGRGRARHPPDDQRGPQHQRHADLQPRALRRRDRGLPEPVWRRADGRPVGASPAWRRFFISRVDTEVDRRLDEIGTPEALALRGKAAVAQGKLAYQLFAKAFSGPRWERAGRSRRPGAAAAVGLDVDQEPGLPRHAVRRQADRSRHRQHAPRRHDRGLRRPRHRGPHRRRRTSTRPRRRGRALHDVGVDMDDVALVLEDEGVASFAKSFDELLGALSTKAAELRANDPN